MLNSKDIFNDLRQSLTQHYDSQEAQAIAFLVLEHTFNLSKTEVLIEKKIKELPQNWSAIQLALAGHVPVQYVLGQAYFYGLRFQVNPGVLIPRPETEELVAAAIDLGQAEPQPIKVLDIGTGSGCIAIAMAKYLVNSQVTAYDISELALATAKQNAINNQVTVNFEQRDILKTGHIADQFELVLSNPPYVRESEKAQMLAHVNDHEPHLALFVTDQNPLIFYKAIAQFCMTNLKAGGHCLVEINEAFGQETAQIFEVDFFQNVKIIKDIHQKDRFVVATRKA
jgi:release factor glutamine methyltransferase